MKVAAAPLCLNLVFLCRTNLLFLNNEAPAVGRSSCMTWLLYAREGGREHRGNRHVFFRRFSPMVLAFLVLANAKMR